LTFAEVAEGPAVTADSTLTSASGLTRSKSGFLVVREGRSRLKLSFSFFLESQFVTLLSTGFPMEISVISDGLVLPYILDPHFQDNLPVIPAEVSQGVPFFLSSLIPLGSSYWNML
jgi:hypothetical protein